MAFLPKASVFDLNFKRPGIYEVNLDVEAAQFLLQMNTNNRFLRVSFVDYLCELIHTGAYIHSHPANIVVSSDSVLMDGQHRLHAIVKAGVTKRKPITVRVETGAKWVVREHMDDGVPRSLEDRVTFFDDHKSNRIAAQIAKCWHTMTTSRSRRITVDEAVEFKNKHSHAIQWVADIRRCEAGTAQMAVAVAAIEYYEISKEKAHEFYKDLFVPAGNIHQSQMLRDALLKGNRNSGMMGKIEVYKKSIFCMKGHLEKRQIKIVRAGSW